VLRKTRLFSPGPTPLSPRVQEALARPILHHRSDEFREIFRGCIRDLQGFLKTTEDVILLASSGTGGMEAALVNTVSPGEQALCLVAGRFGERWVEIGRAHGIDAVPLEAPWGEAVSVDAVAQALAKTPKVHAVCVQYSESATGAQHDVRALGKLLRDRPSTVLIVDAISAAGAMPLEAEAWGLDVVIVGSQKALSLPPGLAILSVSAKAWRQIEACRSPRFYFDLLKERKGQRDGSTAFTPAIAHLSALRASLDEIAALGGVDALVTNAAMLASMTRAAAVALGLPLVSPHHAGDALTALYPPEGIDAARLLRFLKSEFRATVAGGQGRLSGRILRIAHLGYYDVLDILGLLAALEVALSRHGHVFPAAAGVAAAQAEYLRRTKAASAEVPAASTRELQT
jgi:aspartate aminotransferase-like enzyme